MNLNAIEIASRQAWPALYEQELPFGVLRFAHGVSRRANSLSIFAGATIQWSQLCAQTEAFFQQFELPAIVRVLRASSLAESRDLDEYLAHQGYQLQTPTQVMVCDLVGIAPAKNPDQPGAIPVATLPAWLDAWHGMLGKSAREREVHQLMLQRLPDKHHLLVQHDSNGQAVCCGMAVSSGALMGVFGIATALAHRNRGCAANLVQQLLNWGAKEGARHAYLQVEEANKPAIAVYKKLGFLEEYGYWYREKPLGNYTIR